MEAQRISLSQIHAAQLELLQEETDASTHPQELQPQGPSDQGGQGKAVVTSSIFYIYLCFY